MARRTGFWTPWGFCWGRPPMSRLTFLGVCREIVRLDLIIDDRRWNRRRRYFAGVDVVIA